MTSIQSLFSRIVRVLLSGCIRPSIACLSAIEFYKDVFLSELLDCSIYQKFILLELFDVT